MVYELKRRTGFAASHVVGMAGALDSARFALFLAREAGVSVSDVRAMVLGGHGDDMVPVLSDTHHQRRSRDAARREGQACRHHRPHPQGRRRDREPHGHERLLRAGAGAIAMAEAYLRNQKRLLPCAAYLDGEYGYKDLYMGVPVIIGAGGVEKILQIELTAEEKAMLEKSAKSVQGIVDVVKKAAG